MGLVGLLSHSNVLAKTMASPNLTITSPAMDMDAPAMDMMS